MNVWIRTHVSSGDVTIHKSAVDPPNTKKGNSFFNREGEQVIEFNALSDGRLVYTMVEVALYD